MQRKTLIRTRTHTQRTYSTHADLHPDGVRSIHTGPRPGGVRPTRTQISADVSLTPICNLSASDPHTSIQFYRVFHSHWSATCRRRIRTRPHNFRFFSCRLIYDLGGDRSTRAHNFRRCFSHTDLRPIGVRSAFTLVCNLAASDTQAHTFSGDRPAGPQAINRHGFRCHAESTASVKLIRVIV